MAAELIKRGYSVVGADASAAMLARARSLLGDDVQLIEAILLNLGPLQCSTQRPRTSMGSTT